MIKFIKHEIIQKHIWDNPKFKQIKGATHTNGSGTVFKIRGGKLYYWHSGNNTWERSVVFLVKEVEEMYTIHP